MEDEEEEVLCYLDRVLEEEEESEYGDGELEPITTTHRQFKVRHELERSWMQRKKSARRHTYKHTHEHTHAYTLLQYCLSKWKIPVSVLVCLWRDVCFFSEPSVLQKCVCVCKSVRVTAIGVSAWPDEAVTLQRMSVHGAAAF